MFTEKFVDFFDNLIKCSQQTKEKFSKSKNKENYSDIINDYNLNDKSKKYIEKHILNLITTPLKKYLETKSSEKYSTYLKMLQNMYCDISEFSNIFSNFISLKMTLKLYFIIMRTYYYNNQQFSKILLSKETFSLFIDYFFKDILLYSIKLFPNIDINEKKNVNDININEIIINSFIGKVLPFIKDESNNNELNIPFEILYNISDYRYDIMKDLVDKGFIDTKKYFEKQEKYLNLFYNNNNKNTYLSIIIYILDEIKEKYFVERFIKYLELKEEDKKIVLDKIEK